MKQLQLILIMVLVGNSISFASNIVSIQTTKTTSGDTGTFFITMKNDVTVNGLHFILQYENNLITPIKVTPVNRAGSLSGSSAFLYGENKINFLVYDQGSNFVMVDSGFIFEVDYIVRDSLSDSTKSRLVFTKATAADLSIAILPFEFVDAEINISPSVDVKDLADNLPKVFELYQNYPNPFNPTTTIQFDIPKATSVTLKVYNILGQEVATLVHEKREAGKHFMQLNGINMASGVYFYRLIAGDYISTKKFLLLK